VRPIRFADDRARGDAARDLGAILAAVFRRSPLFAIEDPRSCRLGAAGRHAEKPARPSLSGIAVNRARPVGRRSDD